MFHAPGVQVVASVPVAGPVPPGTSVWATGNDGQRIDFETGHGVLEDFGVTIVTYNVDPARNAPDQLPAFVKSEIAKWARIIKEADIKLD